MDATPEPTPKARMLAAYRGRKLDRVAVAPEFWYYLPARLLGLDMIEFSRVPFWQALQQTFRHYDCEGWGLTGPAGPPGPSGCQMCKSSSLVRPKKTETAWSSP